MQRLLFLLPAFALLAACASAPPPAPEDDQGLVTNVGDAAGSTYTQTRDGLGDAALSPLEDLNLRRDEIPPLLAAITTPYDLPEDLTCLDIERMLAQLDRVLGPDWDTPDPDERLRTEKLADGASEAALGAIASEARGFIPFRSLVRKATGAETHEKKYNQAYKKGAQRRAYLKGIGLAKGCAWPARPNPHPPSRDEIVFKGDQPTPAGAPQGAPPISSLPNPPEAGSGALQSVPPQ
ncbi:MAG: hypothetical protein KDA53_01725 [Hyphomonas sp.]|nr:hypothetical protein [Hyphomonas sp.]